MLSNILLIIGAVVLGGIAALAPLWLAMAWRRIVPPNFVHIVNSQKKSETFGAGHPRNVYYEIPSNIPVFGVTVRKFPVSNFEIPMNNYKAYDKDRVPFELDLMAFLRISDPIMASQRIDSFDALRGQLFKAMESAVRTVLGGRDIHAIMLERTSLGEAFTKELADELKSWGVTTVKNLALNDVRDVRDVDGKEGPIHRIMAMKTSAIETESRRVVAEQRRLAEVAEIDNKQQRDVREQEAKQIVGQREALQVKEVGIAQEKAKQDIAQEAAVTKQRDMQVLSVATQRQAEINRDAAIVKAEENKQTTVIAAQAAKEVAITKAEGEKQNITLIADGKLAEAKREAEGIQAKGEAQGKADTAINLATVTPQITLAKEIGGNDGYQKYLVDIRNVEKEEAIGVANAGALEQAEIKVIATGGNVPGGLASIGDLFSAKGGVGLGAALEGFAATEEGQRVLGALIPQLTAAKSVKGNGKQAVS